MNEQMKLDTTCHLHMVVIVLKREYELWALSEPHILVSSLMEITRRDFSTLTDFNHFGVST